MLYKSRGLRREHSGEIGHSFDNHCCRYFDIPMFKEQILNVLLDTIFEGFFLRFSVYHIPIISRRAIIFSAIHPMCWKIFHSIQVWMERFN